MPAPGGQYDILEVLVQYVHVLPHEHRLHPRSPNGLAAVQGLRKGLNDGRVGDGLESDGLSEYSHVVSLELEGQVAVDNDQRDQVRAGDNDCNDQIDEEGEPC